MDRAPRRDDCFAVCARISRLCAPFPGLIGTALLVTHVGCASYETLAVGEALTVGDGRRRPALAVEAAEGLGSSKKTASTFTELRGRLLLGTERQQLAGFVGLSQLRWVAGASTSPTGGDRTPIFGHVNVGLGAEHLAPPRSGPDTPHRFFLEPIAQARLGTGFVLAEHQELIAPLNPWGVEANPGMIPPVVREVLRTRTLLTLALVGDVDARFTRAPLYVASLMLGLAKVEEPRPLPPSPLPPL